jgi:hypothetical protein
MHSARCEHGKGKHEVAKSLLSKAGRKVQLGILMPVRSYRLNDNAQFERQE